MSIVSGLRKCENICTYVLYGNHTGFAPTHPPLQWMLGTLCLRVKQVNSELDQSSPSVAEVKNDGTITTTPHMSSWHNA
jgi:hypothetical protein